MEALDRVAPLHPERVLAVWERVRGERLALSGLAGSGEVGALFVRRPDGTPAVLTRGQDAAALRATAGPLRRARQAGVPAPDTLDVVEHDDLVLLLQERLPGAPPDQVDDGLLSQLLATLQRLHGLVRDEAVRPLELYLDRSGPGFCRHESLAGDARTRELLDWVRAVGRQDGSGLPGTDLVHPDPHPGNVLVDGRGRLTGLVDWDAPGRGDLRLGWVVILFDLCRGRRADERYAGLSEGAVEGLWERLGNTPPSLLRRCWAHLSLRQVDWSLRHHGPEEVERHLSTATEGRRRFGLG